jgi:hypothetical protein
VCAECLDGETSVSGVFEGMGLERLSDCLGRLVLSETERLSPSWGPCGAGIGRDGVRQVLSAPINYCRGHLSHAADTKLRG